MSDSPRFQDPELQAVLNFLRSAGPPARVPSPVAMSTPDGDAVAVAEREGLDLGPALARRAGQSRAQHSAGSPGGRRRPVRPSRATLGEVAERAIREGMPRVRRSDVAVQVRAWARLGLWPQELTAWIRALGKDGAAVAAQCLREGVTLAALEVRLDGVQVRRRLRGGETLDALLAHAAHHYPDLRLRERR
ncbi:hypothetical protein [Streptomyces sp. 8N706]|uniref:hypothetical protein n=1 Tax=Streptomyces sp. 8N706 TaxID=3457416 RepID=UPI003FD26037